MDGPADGSRKRMTKLVSRDDDMDLMRIVGRVLSGKFCMDSEEEDVENFEIGANKSAADANTCPDASQGPTPADPTGNASDKDLDAVNLGCGGEGSGLNGKVDLITPKPLPSGELEIEKGNDVKADVSNGERYDVKGTGIDKDLAKVDLGCGGEGSGLNGKMDRFTDEPVPDDGLKIEEVNDVNTDVLAVERYEENRITEREGKYHVGDLVWGKVRSHPWWPGQIFDPSAASDKALRYCEREHLIAYFGDQSFAWNDGSKIKPFRKYFAEMEKQSNGEGFGNAVACALEEVSRRTEFGLSCPCLPQEVHSKIQSQVMANAGIREESSTREGGDNLSTAASLSPGGVVQFLESLAEAPHLNPDRLQFSVTKAQLLAFNRWRGHSQLPVLEMGSGLLEDDTQITVVDDEMDSRIVMEEQLPGPDGGSGVPSRKRKSTTRGLSQKRKCLSRDVGLPDIKGKHVLDSPRSEEAINRRGRKKLYSGEKQEPTSAIASASEVKRRKTMLPPESSNDEALQTLEGSDGTMAIIPSEMPTPDEILSKLSFAARNPMQGYKSINPFLGMLRGFRNSVCAEKAGGLSQIDHAAKHKGKQISNMETPRIFESEGIEDSYWTDRIIQSDLQDQALFESGKPRKSRGELETGVGLVLDKYGNDSVVDKGKERLPAPTNEISEEETPTALILNFSDLDSIPSIIHLNEIFTHNGPLKESETAILSKSKRAKVIFKRRADAETAFSSLGKYVMFGPSLVSYRLHYAPTPRKARGTTGGKNKRTDP